MSRTQSSTLSLSLTLPSTSFFFFFNDTATTEIYTLSLHDALPISGDGAECGNVRIRVHQIPQPLCPKPRERVLNLDRAAQPQHVRVRIRARDARPAGISAPVVEMFVAVTVTVSLPIGPIRSVGRRLLFLTFLLRHPTENQKIPLTPD